MISSRIALRTIAVILIVLGIAFCIGFIAFQYFHCVDIWNTSHKSQEFASASEYFFAVSKGAILIALVGGSIPVIVGSLLLRKTAVKQ